jgi:hypothetical protein
MPTRMATPSSPGGHPQHEREALLAAEQAGSAFLALVDGEGRQQIVSLNSRARLWIGRDPDRDITLDWDPEVSGLHAQLEPVGEDWTLTDDGLSRNGTFVNGERLRGRRRLDDGDVLVFGATVALFRAAAREASRGTVRSAGSPPALSLSPSQRRVLVALCRPFKDSSPFAAAPSNPDIAAELSLSVDAVKTHMRLLFAKFEVDDLPQNRKRLSLIQRAIQSGVLSEDDLR